MVRITCSAAELVIVLVVVRLAKRPDQAVITSYNDTVLRGISTLNSHADRRIRDVGEEFAFIIEENDVTVIGADNNARAVLNAGVAGVVFGDFMGNACSLDRVVVAFKFGKVFAQLVVAVAVGSRDAHNRLGVDVLETQLEVAFETGVKEAQVHARHHFEIVPAPE